MFTWVYQGGGIGNNKMLANFFWAFILQCNGVFYMMSGKFNLCKNFECKMDYIKYYIDKFVSIIIPYGVGTCLLVLLEVIISKQYCNLNGYIYRCFEAFFSTNATGHLWFVCTLIGILVGNPFLAKMVTSMKDEELKVLFGVGIVWNFITIYLVNDLGFSIGISGWFLWGWVFIYFLGYFCDRIINDKNVKMIYCLGIVGLIITVFGMTYLKTFKYSTDLSVGYILFVMSCYLFLQRHISINSKMMKKVFSPIVTYMAKYSFVAYIMHFFILNNFARKLITQNEGIIQYMLCVLITFIVTYITSILVSNILIKPIQVIALKLIALVSKNYKDNSLQEYNQHSP